jgi:nitrite reductase (NADH) large subunit
MSEPLIIIGKGMAATRLVDELSKRALGRYSIAVIGAEPRRAYNRVLLSSLLADEVDAADIELKPASWWQQRGVTTLYGQPVTGIDTAARTVTLADGMVMPFGKLVLATGSEAIRLPLPGADLKGVMTFREMEDVERMRAAVKPGTKVVVIGGGLLGLEAAYGLAKAGADITVLHLMDRLMERQIDASAGTLLKAEIERRGMKVELEASTKQFLGTTHVEGVELRDGRVLPAELVVMAIGIKPNAWLAKASRVTVNRGVVVDDHMETNVSGIYAIGECAEHRGIAYGLVEPAYEQARVLAECLAERPADYTGSLLATNLKVSGVNVFSAGDFLGGEHTQVVTMRDPAFGAYRKLVLRESEGATVLSGCVLLGDTSDGLWYLDLIRRGAAVDAMRDNLIFGRGLAEQAA